MARDYFDVRTSALCDEAEKAAVMVRVVEQAWPALRGFGQEPEVLSARLGEAAARVREAHGVHGSAEDFLTAYRGDAHRLLGRYAEAQARARSALRGIALLDPDGAGLDARAHAARLRRGSLRFRGVLAEVRSVQDDIGRPDHPLLVHSAIVRWRDEAAAFEAEAVALDARLVAQERKVLLAGRAFREARGELCKVLRQLQALWEAVVLFTPTPIPELVFEGIEAAHAQRRREQQQERAAEAQAEVCDDEVVDPVTQVLVDPPAWNAAVRSAP